METIFKSEHGEVWKSQNGYGTYTAGHMLCIDLAKEIERLRVELDRRKKWANEFSQRARKAEEEVERCHARLEIDHVFVVPQGASALTDVIRKEVPYQQRAEMVDGITARDASIAILEEEIETLSAELQKGSQDHDETDNDLFIAKQEIERLRSELQQYRKAAGHETND